MKLSDAIRLGGMMTPQGKGAESMLSTDAPCALGGGLLACGKFPTNQEDAAGILDETWPFVRDIAICPCGDANCEPTSIMVIIMKLNDLHEWSRSKIADWLATVEPASVQSSVIQRR